ncbi:MAG: type II toxin-antitoxin system RelE/ParE family toxin, partial [Verrucomicrobia bacterium]|nr:type II toxin-antitoxin system RelE/ParE family toxin [Verrucomicrobiota bacterium]
MAIEIACSQHCSNERLGTVPPRNETKFKKVEGSNGIFEFKSYQMRLYCFFDGGDLIICTNGAVKKRDRSD